MVDLVLIFFQIKDLEVSGESTKKPQKTKEIKKELEELIGNSKIHYNIEIEEKAKCVKSHSRVGEDN